MKRVFKMAILATAMGVFALMWTNAAFAQESGVPECEFPAQVVEIQRPVNITSASFVVNVNTDICGNVIEYTEQLASQTTAGIGDFGCVVVDGGAYCGGNEPPLQVEEGIGDIFIGATYGVNFQRPDITEPDVTIPE